MIVVTGMHRGGTSLVANLLMELGIPFGDPTGFLPADRWNARGYFEQCDVLDLNNRIVTGRGFFEGAWRRLLGQIRYLAQPRAATLERRFERLLPEARALGAKYRGVAVKDPRFCLTWPLWNAEGLIERCVICMRHPSRSARSLQRRQRIPLRLGIRFWEYHLESLLDGIDQLPCLVVDTDRLAAGDWREELAAIDAFFGLDRSEDERQRIYTRVFDPDLNHSGSAESAPLPPRAQALWEALKELKSRSRVQRNG